MLSVGTDLLAPQAGAQHSAANRGNTINGTASSGLGFLQEGESGTAKGAGGSGNVVASSSSSRSGRSAAPALTTFRRYCRYHDRSGRFADTSCGFFVDLFIATESEEEKSFRRNIKNKNETMTPQSVAVLLAHLNAHRRNLLRQHEETGCCVGKDTNHQRYRVARQVLDDSCPPGRTADDGAAESGRGFPASARSTSNAAGVPRSPHNINRERPSRNTEDRSTELDVEGDRFSSLTLCGTREEARQRFFTDSCCSKLLKKELLALEHVPVSGNLRNVPLTPSPSRLQPHRRALRRSGESNANYGGPPPCKRKRKGTKRQTVGAVDAHALEWDAAEALGHQKQHRSDVNPGGPCSSPFHAVSVRRANKDKEHDEHEKSKNSSYDFRPLQKSHDMPEKSSSLRRIFSRRPVWVAGASSGSSDPPTAVHILDGSVSAAHDSRRRAAGSSLDSGQGDENFIYAAGAKSTASEKEVLRAWCVEFLSESAILKMAPCGRSSVDEDEWIPILEKTLSDGSLERLWPTDAEDVTSPFLRVDVRDVLDEGGEFQDEDGTFATETIEAEVEDAVAGGPSSRAISDVDGVHGSGSHFLFALRDSTSSNPLLSWILAFREMSTEHFVRLMVRIGGLLTQACCRALDGGSGSSSVAMLSLEVHGRGDAGGGGGVQRSDAVDDQADDTRPHSHFARSRDRVDGSEHLPADAGRADEGMSTEVDEERADVELLAEVLRKLELGSFIAAPCSSPFLAQEACLLVNRERDRSGAQTPMETFVAGPIFALDEPTCSVGRRGMPTSANESSCKTTTRRAGSGDNRRRQVLANIDLNESDAFFHFDGRRDEDSTSESATTTSEDVFSSDSESSAGGLSSESGEFRSSPEENGARRNALTSPQPKRLLHLNRQKPWSKAFQRQRAEQRHQARLRLETELRVPPARPHGLAREVEAESESADIERGRGSARTRRRLRPSSSVAELDSFFGTVRWLDTPPACGSETIHVLLKQLNKKSRRKRRTRTNRNKNYKAAGAFGSESETGEGSGSRETASADCPRPHCTAFACNALGGEGQVQEQPESESYEKQLKSLRSRFADATTRRTRTRGSYNTVAILQQCFPFELRRGNRYWKEGQLEMYNAERSNCPVANSNSTPQLDVDGHDSACAAKVLQKSMIENENKKKEQQEETDRNGLRRENLDELAHDFDTVLAKALNHQPSSYVRCMLPGCSACFSSYEKVRKHMETCCTDRHCNPEEIYRLRVADTTVKMQDGHITPPGSTASVHRGTGGAAAPQDQTQIRPRENSETRTSASLSCAAVTSPTQSHPILKRGRQSREKHQSVRRWPPVCTQACSKIANVLRRQHLLEPSLTSGAEDVGEEQGDNYACPVPGCLAAFPTRDATLSHSKDCIFLAGRGGGPPGLPAKGVPLLLRFVFRDDEEITEARRSLMLRSCTSDRKMRRPRW
ncbi:unnamed protein product [Amoebophrya sp. A120]|nr:unnamed protein product [Amoebophrya sp. A120]|eukprot:GSA120T00020351001.1